MKKIAVIYTTRYGTTRTYAEWIAQPVAADLFPARGKREDLEPYDTIVFGGYRRGLQIAGLDYIKKNFDALNGKRVIIFYVGLGPLRREAPERVLAANFTSAMRKQITVFGLRGAMNMRRLRGNDRFKMSLMRMKLKMKRAERMTDEEVALLEATEHPVNFIDENAVKPIVKTILGIGQPVTYFSSVEEKTAEIKTPPPKRERTPSRPASVEAKQRPERKKPAKKTVKPKRLARKKTVVADKRARKKKISAKQAAGKKKARPVNKRPVKKAAARKRQVRKAVLKRKALKVKKRPVKKTVARRRPAKKAAAKRTTKKKAASKMRMAKKKKAVGKKVSAKRAVARQRPVKKAGGKRKAAAKRKSLKINKRPAKKAAAKKKKTTGKRRPAKRAARQRPGKKAALKKKRVVGKKAAKKKSKGKARRR